MMKTTATVIAAGGFAAALALSACSNPIEDAANNLIEGAAEELVERGAGDGADIDLNLDGEGAELPADWPDDLPVPEGDILQSATIDGGMSIGMTVDGVEVLDELEAELVAAGYVLNADASSSLSTGGEEVLESRMFNGPDHDVVVGLLGAPGDYILSMTVVPGDGAVAEDEAAEEEQADSGAADDASAEDAGTSDGDVEMASGELPSSWPAAVPAPEGDVSESLSTGTGVWANLTVPDASAFDSYADALTAAGFSEDADAAFELEGGDGAVTKAKEFSDGDYTVAIILVGDGSGFYMSVTADQVSP